MIKFLIMDVDGTLTDGKIYLGETGEVFKVFDTKDGYGIHEILPQYNIVPVIITARTSKILENRCIELGISELYQGERDKLDCLLRIFEKNQQETVAEKCLENVAYIGDDILDIQCMKKIKEYGGVVGCPADAVNEVIALADFVSERNGGNGAVREFIEYIVKSRKQVIETLV